MRLDPMCPVGVFHLLSLHIANIEFAFTTALPFLSCLTEGVGFEKSLLHLSPNPASHYHNHTTPESKKTQATQNHLGKSYYMQNFVQTCFFFSVLWTLVLKRESHLHWTFLSLSISSCNLLKISLNLAVGFQGPSCCPEGSPCLHLISSLFYSPEPFIFTLILPNSHQRFILSPNQHS